MAENLGKKFEDRFKKDYQRCFPGTLIYRLPDQQSGYAGGGSSNPCDFFCFTGNEFLMVECKCHAGMSIPFTAIRQYDRMLDYKDLKKVFPGVVVWFYDKDTVIWVSIDEMEKMKLDGEKSIGLRMIDDKKPYKKSYNIITLPSKKLRAFMETDYNYLVEQLVQLEGMSECTWPQGLSPSEHPGSLQAFLKKYPWLSDRPVTEEDMKEFNNGN